MPSCDVALKQISYLSYPANDLLVVKIEEASHHFSDRRRGSARKVDSQRQATSPPASQFRNSHEWLRQDGQMKKLV